MLGLVLLKKSGMPPLASYPIATGGFVIAQRPTGPPLPPGTCYLVLCIARDVDERPRTVADFLKDEVFVGGAIIQRDGDSWMALGRRMAVRQIIPAVPS